MEAPVHNRTPSAAFSMPKRPMRRFRRRVFFYLLTLSLATSVVSGASYYSRQVKFIEKDRRLRAHTLLTSLATQAELGAYAGDASLCDLPSRRTFREEDVVLVGIYDTKGREILRLSAPALGQPAPLPPEALQRLGNDPDASPMRFAAGEYDDMYAPIVTTVRHAAVAASSEPGAAPSRREVVGLARIGLSLTPAREQLAEVLATGVYLAAGLLFLGALAAILIAGRISDPILALAQGADQIREGNLDVSIRVSARDEIGMLADSFNKMAAQLRETMAKLESLNKNLESEVTRRTDEIVRSAEFTQVLNAPIDPQADPTRAGAKQGSELAGLLDGALAALMSSTGVSAAAVLLTRDEVVDFELEVAAARGAERLAFGAPPTQEQCAAGKPIVEPTPAEPGQPLIRAVVPILFRGLPEGAIVLLAPDDHAVEFAARAAGQLAIAVSNARAFTALQHLARELKERNAALEKQRDQLSDMNRLKSEFLANVSHELRTPLNAILGYTEIIREGIYGPTTGEQREGLEGIEDSGRNLLTLINQILDLSKVESGKVELYLTEVPVHEVLHSVVSEVQPLLKGRPYKLQVRAAATLIIRTDAAKLKQVVTNLVSNAIKFTERGAVTLELKPADGGGCTIAVKDTGIGIRKEDQHVIFEEFRQADGSSTRKFQGTGLGLAIVRRFVALLGGTITVESQLNVGSTFTVTLPAEARPGSRPPPTPAGARISSTMAAVRVPASTPDTGRLK